MRPLYATSASAGTIAATAYLAAISVDLELGEFRFALFTAHIGLVGALSMAATRGRGFCSCSITLSRRTRRLHSQYSMPAPPALRAAG